MAERFEREARALGALNHPNIVTIHSIEQDEDVRYLTMELVGGQTLQQRIVEGPLSVDEVLGVALDLSSALDAAHQRGIVHRDLKPANVMLTDDGRLKVLDFGIAKLAALGPSQASMDGMIIGTVAYMAPEQLENGPVDARTDLFALGMMLFECVTGEHPFPARSPMKRARAILNREPADLRSLRPGPSSGQSSAASWRKRRNDAIRMPAPCAAIWSTCDRPVRWRRSSRPTPAASDGRRRGRCAGGDGGIERHIPST